MPLSTSVLKCAINLGSEGPGSCFTTTGLLSVLGWLRAEHIPVTEPETAKHESSAPILVGLTSQSCIPCQFQMDESLSDMYGYSECSGTPSNNVSCDMPGSCNSLVYTQKQERYGQIRSMNWLILIMPLSTSVLSCAISLGGEGPGSCFTPTGLLSIY